VVGQAPMIYLDWDKHKIDIKEKKEFEKLNQSYLDTNPYLKSFFARDDIRFYIENKNILDIGTGWGSSALLLASYGGMVTAIDLSDVGIRGAIKNNEFFGSGKNIKIIKMDAEKLSFPSDYFDFFVFMGSYTSFKFNRKNCWSDC